MEPLYTSSNVKAAYQLRWSLALFAKSRLPSADIWLSSLRDVVERDGEGRWNEIREEQLDKTRDMVLRAAREKKHRLSRLSLLADHLHLVAGIPFNQSPQDVALAYMNNLAFAHGMQAVFCPSYYSGTAGEYDTGAIWTSLASSRGPTDTGSAETGRRWREACSFQSWSHRHGVGGDRSDVRRRHRQLRDGVFDQSSFRKCTFSADC